MGDTSATGVAFTRNPATGENLFFGEWLINAQGEDVVAGIRTPLPLNDETKTDQNKHMHSMVDLMPKTYKELDAIRTKLEKHYKDMLDIEFTVEDKKLYMLQCRTGKRGGKAAINMALDMFDEGLIDEKTAVLRYSQTRSWNSSFPSLNPRLKPSNPILSRDSRRTWRRNWRNRLHRAGCCSGVSPGQESHPRPRRDLAGRRRRNESRSRHFDLSRRHDLACGACCPWLGQNPALLVLTRWLSMPATRR
jgi:hypothetical protein